MALFTTTQNLGLRRIIDGQKPWGTEARENMDIIDAYINTILSTGNINVILNSNNMINAGSPNQAAMFINSSGDIPYKYLNFGLDGEAFWLISTAESSGYVDGGEIVLTLDWNSIATTGDTTFDVYFKAINDGDDISTLTFDNTPRQLTLVPSTGTHSKTTLTFVPDIGEIKSGSMFAVKIIRNNTFSGDFDADVEFFGLNIIHNLPKLDPQLIFNYYEGIGVDALNVDYTYNSSGLVETITETTLAEEERTITFTYNSELNPDTIVMVNSTHTFTETYTYTDGILTNISMEVVKNIS